MDKKYDEENYRVLLDKRWSLEDLNEFSRLYMQNYAFLYSLETSLGNTQTSNLTINLNDHKLRDGLTYVNIYTLFKRNVPYKDHPKIRAISYASPGFIELILNYEVAIQLAVGMGIFLKGLASTAETYNKLHDIYLELGRKRKEKQNHLLKLEAEKVKYAHQLTENLAEGLGFQSLADMYEKIGNEEEVAKLLMAHYRRMKWLSTFVEKGKVKLPKE
ncbi:hypothetical protein E0H80_13115 [Acinetobacter sp. ANC 4779]|uniref:hypothetical protein n=1 Tax=Acinetobacter sp. ANC 4779 TaxID=2529848 RepID=UPI00103DB125|nr:hypothetical protein [Acinetobacter sp. ANC 4779]TCB49244.1 hypothetical protein E0H80_13115 [Acinetobacter sp. ANC 4779]